MICFLSDQKNEIAAQMSILQRVTEVEIDRLVLHHARSQLRWLRHLTRMPPECLLGEVFWEEAPGKTQDSLERLHFGNKL